MAGPLIVAVETTEEVVVQMAELVTVAEEAAAVEITGDLLPPGEVAGKQPDLETNHKCAMYQQ